MPRFCVIWESRRPSRGSLWSLCLGSEYYGAEALRMEASSARQRGVSVRDYSTSLVMRAYLYLSVVRRLTTGCGVRGPARFNT